MNIAILLRSEKAERRHRRIPTTGRRNRCDGQDRHIHDNTSSWCGRRMQSFRMVGQSLPKIPRFPQAEYTSLQREMPAQRAKKAAEGTESFRRPELLS